MVAAVAAVVVLGQVELGHWSSGTDGQHHLGILWWRCETTVAVLAGVQESGASGLDGPTGTTIAALVAAVVAASNVSTVVAASDVSAVVAASDVAASDVTASDVTAIAAADVANVTVLTAVFAAAAMAIAGVEEDRAQLLAATITGTGNDLYGTLVVATGSSGAGCGSSTAIGALAIVGDAAVSVTGVAGVTVVAAADS